MKNTKIITNKFDIEFFEKNTTVKLIIVSLIIGIFIIYLNFAFVTHELAFLGMFFKA